MRESLMLTICAGLLGSLVLGGCQKVEQLLYSPKVKVRCQILKDQCLFRNFGDPGEACVTVTVFHLESGRTIVSKPVCSGRIERDEPTVVDIDFAGQDPIRLCMGEQLKLDFKKTCKVEISEIVD